jgi:CHAT domain-containing protein
MAWCWGTLVGAMFVFLAAVSVLGQMTPNAGGTASCVNMKPGIVVETVAKNSEAEKAGLAEGDVILAWSRGEAKGDIRSPFDLSEVEIEQEPRGQVTLSGMRGGSEQKWPMGPGKWDLGARPFLPEALLTIYNEGEALVSKNELTEAALRWRTTANKAEEFRCPWLRVWILEHAATALAANRHWNESDVLYQDGIERASSLSSETRATLLRAWAATFLQRSDWTRAELHEGEALEESKKISDSNFDIEKSLYTLGRIASFRGDLARAEDYTSRALALSEALAPNSLEVARPLNNLGIIAAAHGDLAKAEEYYTRAMAIREKLTPGSLEVSGSLNNLGIVAYDRQDLNKAEDYYHRALVIRQKLAPGSLDVADSFQNLGNVAYTRQDLAKAEEYYLQGMEIREKLAPDSLSVATSLDGMANVAYLRGNLAKAAEYHKQALTIRERLAPGSLGVANSLNNLGAVMAGLGDLAKTEEYNRRALAIREKLEPDGLEVATSLNNLGIVANDRGDLAKAEQYLRRSLAIKEKVAPGSLEVAETLVNLADAKANGGDLTQSEDFYRSALKLIEELAPDSVDLASTLDNLGEIERRRGNIPQAEEHFRRAFQIEEKVAPDSTQMAETLSHLVALELARVDRAKAEEYERRELAIRSKLAPETADYAAALATLAGILHEKQQAEEASRLYNEAIDVLDHQLTRLGGSAEVRADFRAKRADYYSEYADLLVEQNKPTLAFDVLERSRARTLLEMLAGAHVDIHQGADPALIEKERLLQANLTAKTNRKISLLEGEHTPEQLASVNRDLDEVLSEYQELEGQIRTSSPKYAALTQPKPLSASEAQQLLDPQTVLLNYSLGAKRSLVFVVTPTSLDSYELPKREEVENTARRTYDLLTTRNRRVEGETGAQRAARLARKDAEYRKTSATLSQIVLGPVMQRLEGKRLVIVADGALQFVPFAVLPVPASDASKAAVPLMAEHEIVNLPSASVLASLRRQASERATQPTKEVAILADPVFDKNDPRVGKTEERTSAGDKEVGRTLTTESTEHLTRSIQDVSAGTQQSGMVLSRLAFSRREAAAIMAITKPGAGMEALDFNASRETALSKELSQYRIVHFATHGLLDNEHPELSGLVLSLVGPDGKPRDGFLDLQDVYNLTVPADLVVLSACETGLGKEISGEGLVGLTRGFMYAGASRVVASLWKVDDVATSELMAEFYKGMLQAGLPPAAALRQAQLEMQKRKRWAHPYYWAAFTLQGEWK